MDVLVNVGSSALNRLPSSNAAIMVADLSFPMPLVSMRTSPDIAASRVRLPALVISSLARSKTFIPPEPVLSNIANNSVLLSALAPADINLSLGRSSALISIIFMSVSFICRKL